jgi:hypothetical protein
VRPQSNARRFWTVALALLCSVVPVRGQTPETAQATAPVPRLPEIGLPLPHIGLPPIPDPAGRGPRPESQQSRESGGSIHHPPSPVLPIVYVSPPVWLAPPTGAPGEPATGGTQTPIAVPRGPAGGTLTLDVTPAGALQLFVDGYYVGMTDEIGTSIEMPAGAHTVELRGEGYEPVRFSVRLAAGQWMTYRETLRGPGPATADTSRAPVTLYVIPGCFAGSVRPEAASLPQGCDLGRLHTIDP